MPCISKVFTAIKEGGGKILDKFRKYSICAHLVVCGADMSDETLAVLELLHAAVQRAGGGGPTAAHVPVEQLLQYK